MQALTVNTFPHPNLQVSGSGFGQVEKRGWRKRDIYCNMTLGNSVWRSSAITDSVTHVWKEESAYFVYSDHSQSVTIHAKHQGGGYGTRSDDDVGQAEFTLAQVLLDGQRNVNVELTRQKHGKKTGASLALTVDVFPSTTLSLTSFQPSKGNNNKGIFGLLTIVVTRAFDLPVSKEQASSSVKVTASNYGDKHRVFVTGSVMDCPGVDCLNPVYDSAFYMPVASCVQDGKVELTLMNGENILGATTIDHEFIVASENGTVTERRSIGDQGASLEFRVTLYGVKMEEDSNNYNQTPVVGSIRITAVSGRGFKAQRKHFRKDEAPNPYCQITLGNRLNVFRTKAIKDAPKPNWMECHEFPLSDHGQIVHLDAFHERKVNHGADPHLGSTKISVGNLLLSGGIVELELKSKGEVSTGIFIKLNAESSLES